jgi:NDP-sugar pyrophosphorylase family protein
MQGVFGTPLRGMVLCAGMGSRLKGLGSELPKPLLPVCNHPLVTYALALLRGNGVTQVGINLHHLGEMITDTLGSGADYGVDIHYSMETELLGTGGGIRRIADYLTHGGREPCVIVNGKILAEVDLEVVLALHRITGAVGTMVLYETPDAEQWGAVETDPDGRVYRILGEEGPHARARSSSSSTRLTKCMFTGVHIVEPSLIERLPKSGPSCIVRQGYIPALRDGEVISAYVLPGYFFEHSTPARYLQGNVNALRGLARLSHLPGPLVGVSARAQVSPRALLRPPVCIGAGAVVEDGAIVGPDVVLGEGARVERGVHIERAVVFAGAQVRAPVRDAIVTKQAVYPATATDS